MKKNNFLTIFGIALLIFASFCIVMADYFGESWKYFLITNETHIKIDANTYQYTESDTFWVPDSGYIIHSGTFDPGTERYVWGKDVELLQAHGDITINAMADTTFDSDRRGLSDGTIRWWIDIRDSTASSWTLISDTGVVSDPGSVFVADNMDGYFSISELHIPFDWRVTAKCDSDSVGVVKLRSDSVFDLMWKLFAKRDEMY